MQILQKADEIRRKRRQAQELVARILPTIFYAMFGDPGQASQLYPLSTGIESIRNGLSRRRKSSSNEGQIVLRIQDVGDGAIDFSNVNRIPLTDDEVVSFSLREGDMLFVRVNGNRDLVGRNALFKGFSEPVAHNDHLMRIRFKQDKLLPEYVAAFLRTPFGKHEIASKVATSAGNHTINQEGLGNIRIPIPSVRQQKIFLDTVRAHGVSLDALQCGKLEAENLSLALINRAFTGELTAEWEKENAEWIAERQAFYERLPRLLLLAFLQEKSKRAEREALENVVLVTALMKYAFLFQMEGASRRRFYHFVPYHYGPFAKEIYTDLEKLQQDGFVSVNDGEENKTKITLTNPAKAAAALAELPEDLQEDVATIIDRYGDLDHRTLL